MAIPAFKLILSIPYSVHVIFCYIDNQSNRGVSKLEDSASRINAMFPNVINSFKVNLNIFSLHDLPSREKYFRLFIKKT